MKSYTITVNGTAYEVTVEETRKRFRTSSCSSCSSSEKQHRHRRQLLKQQPEQAQLRLQLPYLERF